MALTSIVTVGGKELIRMLKRQNVCFHIFDRSKRQKIKQSRQNEAKGKKRRKYEEEGGMRQKDTK